MDTFSNKICVVTGAASGIGRAVAIELSRRGAVLALSDIDEEGLLETKSMLDNPGSNQVMVDRLDVADADDIEDYAASVKATLGDADCVLNIAGLTRVGNFEDSPLSSFEKIVDVNFWGVIRMTKAFLPQLIATKGGVVNISSVFGLIGFPGQAHYCASKFGIRGFSEALAIEMEDKGVSVTSVHPGGVATSIARNAEVDHLPDENVSRETFVQRFDDAARTSPEKAAQIILRGAAKRKRRVIVGGDGVLISLVQRVFPTSYARVISLFLPSNLTTPKN